MRSLRTRALGITLRTRTLGITALLVLSHSVQVGRIHTAGLIGHIHAHEAKSCAHAAAVLRRQLHRIGLSRGQIGRRQGRITERRITLQFLNHLFVFFTGLDAADTKRYDSQSAQVAPFIAQHLV